MFGKFLGTYKCAKIWLTKSGRYTKPKKNPEILKIKQIIERELFLACFVILLYLKSIEVSKKNILNICFLKVLKKTSKLKQCLFFNCAFVIKTKNTHYNENF